MLHDKITNEAFAVLVMANIMAAQAVKEAAANNTTKKGN